MFTHIRPSFLSLSLCLTHTGPLLSLALSLTHHRSKEKIPTGLILFLGMKNQSVFIFFFINNSVSQFGSQCQQLGWWPNSQQSQFHGIFLVFFQLLVLMPPTFYRDYPTRFQYISDSIYFDTFSSLFMTPRPSLSQQHIYHLSPLCCYRGTSILLTLSLKFRHFL